MQQVVGLSGQQQGGGLGVCPLLAQGLDHGGQHQALHIGVALFGVEGALQQGAKDGGLDRLPVGLGRLQQGVDLGLGQGQHIALLRMALEDLAVETQHTLGQHGAEVAAVHVFPEHAQHLHQGVGLVGVLFEQAAKAVFGQQRHVFGKHAEQGARQESCHLIAGMAAGFERAGQLGQVGRHIAGDLGIQLDRVAHIGHDQEGWSAFAGGQGACIALGLGACFEHGFAKAFGVCACTHLLGLQHKGATAVKSR